MADPAQPPRSPSSEALCGQGDTRRDVQALRQRFETAAEAWNRLRDRLRPPTRGTGAHQTSPSPAQGPPSGPFAVSGDPP